MHGWGARDLSPHDSPTFSKGTARVEFFPVPSVHERQRSITLLTPINSTTIVESLKPRSRLVNYIERISCEILVEIAGIDNEATVSYDILFRSANYLLLRSYFYDRNAPAWPLNAVSRKLINFAVISKLFHLYSARIFSCKCPYTWQLPVIVNACILTSSPHIYT